MHFNVTKIQQSIFCILDNAKNESISILKNTKSRLAIKSEIIK
jgi:hypothetical protein